MTFLVFRQAGSGGDRGEVLSGLVSRRQAVLLALDQLDCAGVDGLGPDLRGIHDQEVSGDIRTLLLPVDDASGDDVDLGVEDDDDDQREVKRNNGGVNLYIINVNKKFDNNNLLRKVNYKEHLDNN